MRGKERKEHKRKGYMMQGKVGKETKGKNDR